MKNSATTVAIVGQGYVGLPVAIRAAEVGFRVIGIDVNEPRISSLKAGESYVGDVTDERLASALATGKYLPTSDYSEVEGFDVAVITVPTPLQEGQPDLTFIESSAHSLAGRLKKGATVILESTTYPGTTEELLVPILESGSGLKAGADFSVGYSPERIDPGNKQWGFVQTPKVVSGIDELSLEKIRAFYDQLVTTTVPVSSPKEAELTKLLENTFRHVNIALVNELTVFAHQLGVNVWESIDAAATKPFGFMKFTPGPGVGGHCLPVDPSYLSWQVRRKLGQTFRFVELANDVNNHMPEYVTQRVIELLNASKLALNGARVLVVGLAYKKNSRDIRESPALRLVELLLEYGAEVSAVDNEINAFEWPQNIHSVELTADTVAATDIAIIVTDHDSLDYSPLTDSSLPVLDTKNLLRGTNIHRL